MRARVYPRALRQPDKAASLLRRRLGGGLEYEPRAALVLNGKSSFSEKNGAVPTQGEENKQSADSAIWGKIDMGVGVSRGVKTLVSLSASP